MGSRGIASQTVTVDPTKPPDTSGRQNWEQERRQRQENVRREQEHQTMTAESGFATPQQSRGGTFGTKQAGSFGAGNAPQIPRITPVEKQDTVWQNGGQKPTASPGRVLNGGVQKGLQGFAQAGGDLFALAEDVMLAPFELFSGQELGSVSDTGLFNTWADRIRESGERIDERYAEDVAAGGKIGEVLYDGTALAVQLAPQAALAMLTGGGSTALQSTAGLRSAANAALSPGLTGTVRRVVENLAKDPQYYLDFSLSVGGRYQRAVDDLMEQSVADEISGRRPAMSETEIRSKAALYAVGGSLLDAAVNSSGGIQTLPKELQSDRTWRIIVDSSIAEGSENAALGVLDRALESLLLARRYDPVSLTDRNAVLSLPAGLEDFAAGAFAGGSTSLGQAAAYSLKDIRAKRIALGEALLDHAQGRDVSRYGGQRTGGKGVDELVRGREGAA